MSDTKTQPPSAPAAGSGFIIVWDDQMGVCAPMGWDDDCEGAICCASASVAVFATRRDARRAIDVSARFAALLRAQGKPTNSDFEGSARRNLRVLPLVPNTEVSDGADRKDKS